ncbi:hypothetical protein [Chryseobacterium sp. Mn2064]|uniref:hypothetical protein n=1 Tax=Chryseobacterium sp. Mn2064 TaxID=3395263 RepID=UPI003BBC19C6
MNYNLNKYYDTVSFNYINEIFSTIFQDIINASEKDHPQSFEKLLNFLLYTLQSKSFNKSLNAFSKSVSLSVSIFPYLSPKYKTSLIERMFESLLSKISFINDYGNIDVKYLELSYLPLINILKLILQDDDHELFNIATSKFEQTLFKIENKEDRENFFFYFNTTLLSWIYFLKHKNSITFDNYDISYFERNLEDRTYEYGFNFLNHFFDLFDKIENSNLWAVKEWEIKETPVNQFYSALTPNTWLTYGLTIILFKFEHIINVNDDLSEIIIRQKFNFIGDDIKDILDDITLQKDEYKNLISNSVGNQNTETTLNFKKEKILNVFSFLKKEVEIDYYKKIKEIPLSKEKIDEFRNNVGKLWEENTVILSILKSLGNLEFLPNDDEVKGYGFFQKLLKMKFAFIEGEYYQGIIGLNDFGGHLARSIDSSFFELLQDDKIIISGDPKGTVLNFIEEAPDKSNVVIFANWSNADKLQDLTYEHNTTRPLFSKKFNGIPVIHQFSKFKNHILVVDFSSIKGQIYTSKNPNWYKNQLIVEITESQKGDITDNKIKEWSEKDGYHYNEDEIDILESNNVNAKIILKYEFIISDDARYIIIDPQS